MSANTKSIYPAIVNNGTPATLTTANTAMDGTGTLATVFTAGGNGSRVDKLWIGALGTNAASVLRVFLGGSYITSLALPATTANNAGTIKDLTLPLDVALDPTQTIKVCLGTAVAGGWQVTAEGGDY